MSKSVIHCTGCNKVFRKRSKGKASYREGLCRKCKAKDRKAFVLPEASNA